jgi:hypothetical protein
MALVTHPPNSKCWFARYIATYHSSALKGNNKITVLPKRNKN